MRAKNPISYIGSMRWKELWLYLSLKPRSPFGDMVCHFCIIVQGPIRQTVAVIVHGLRKATVYMPKGFGFLLLTAWFCRLVRPAQSQSAGSSWGHHQVRRRYVPSCDLSLHLQLFCAESFYLWMLPRHFCCLSFSVYAWFRHQNNLKLTVPVV